MRWHRVTRQSMHPHYTHTPKHLSLNHLASISALEKIELYPNGTQQRKPKPMTNKTVTTKTKTDQSNSCCRASNSRTRECEQPWL